MRHGWRGRNRAAAPAAMSGTTTSPQIGEARACCTQDSLSGWPEMPAQTISVPDNTSGHGGTALGGLPHAIQKSWVG